MWSSCLLRPLCRYSDLQTNPLCTCGHSTCATLCTRYRDIESCDYKSWFDDCTSNSNYSSHALLLPCTLAISRRRGCNLQVLGRSSSSVQLVSALLVPLRDMRQRACVKVRGRYPVLKRNSCDLGVLTALGYGHVNMQPNLHFNVTVAGPPYLLM